MTAIELKNRVLGKISDIDDVEILYDVFNLLVDSLAVSKTYNYQ